MKIYYKFDDRGFSLVSTLIMFFLVGMISFFIFSVFVDFKMNMQYLRLKSEADEILNMTIQSFMESAYDEIEFICRQKAALNIQRQGKCLNNQGLFNTEATAPGDDPDLGKPKFFEVLKDSHGDSKSDGLYCVNLLGCEEVANKQLLRVTLQNMFYQKTKNTVFLMKPVTFIRTRW